SRAIHDSIAELPLRAIVEQEVGPAVAINVRGADDLPAGRVRAHLGRREAISISDPEVDVPPGARPHDVNLAIAIEVARCGNRITLADATDQGRALLRVAVHDAIAELARGRVVEQEVR